MKLSLVSVCVDDDGTLNASKAKAPAPTTMAREGASVLLERLIASSNEHGERLDEQSTLLKGAVEALSERLTAMEASLGGLHAKLDAAERHNDGRVDVLDEAMASCREEVAEIAPHPEDSYGGGGRARRAHHRRGDRVRTRRHLSGRAGRPARADATVSAASSRSFMRHGARR